MLLAATDGFRLLGHVVAVDLAVTTTRVKPINGGAAPFYYRKLAREEENLLASWISGVFSCVL